MDNGGVMETGEGVNPVDQRLLQLLVLSQAILSFQLPFAIIPLVQFTSDRRRMGAFASPGWLKALAWTCAVAVIGLNVVLMYLQTGEWAEAAQSRNSSLVRSMTCVGSCSKRTPAK